MQRKLCLFTVCPGSECAIQKRWSSSECERHEASISLEVSRGDTNASTRIKLSAGSADPIDIDRGTTQGDTLHSQPQALTCAAAI